MDNTLTRKRYCNLDAVALLNQLNLFMKLWKALMSSLVRESKTSGETYSKSRLRTTDFLTNFLWQFYLLSSFCQKSAERKSPKKYFLYFVSMPGLGFKPWLYVQHTTY